MGGSLTSYNSECRCVVDGKEGVICTEVYGDIVTNELVMAYPQCEMQFSSLFTNSYMNCILREQIAPLFGILTGETTFVASLCDECVKGFIHFSDVLLAEDDQSQYCGYLLQMHSASLPFLSLPQVDISLVVLLTAQLTVLCTETSDGGVCGDILPFIQQFVDNETATITPAQCMAVVRKVNCLSIGRDLLQQADVIYNRVVQACNGVGVNFPSTFSTTAPSSGVLCRVNSLFLGTVVAASMFFVMCLGDVVL
eukprot:m.26246 g.26246  ORF g.26246 m.26246 type:complete len:253 (-) comp9252_c0_seq2:1792-2550(-)